MFDHLPPDLKAPIPKLTAPPKSMLAKTQARTKSANGDSA